MTHQVENEGMYAINPYRQCCRMFLRFASQMGAKMFGLNNYR